jgi:hypothetical protein
LTVFLTIAREDKAHAHLHLLPPLWPGLQAGRQPAGKTVQCRQCDGAIVVEDEDERDRPSRSLREDDRDYPRRSREDDRPRRHDDYDDRDPDDRPRRSRRRRNSGTMAIVWWLVGGMIVLVGIFTTVIVLLAIGAFSFNRVTVENYRKLQHGMTEAELQAILGRPRDVTNEMFEQAGRWGGMPMQARMFNDGRVKVLLWESGRNKITVTLFEGKAVGIHGQFDNLGKL